VKVTITSKNLALEGSLLCNSVVVERCVDWEGTKHMIMCVCQRYYV